MRNLLLTLASGLTLSAVCIGQDRHVQRPALPAVLDPDVNLLDVVVVKFDEGSGVRLRDGELTAPAVDLSAVRALIGARRVDRYFVRSEADLDRERARILERLAPQQAAPAELNLYFLVHTAGKADSEALLDRLNAIDVVEVAHPERDPARYRLFDDIPPTTPDFRANQGYQGAPPNGTNAAIGWRIGGGRGENVRVCHLEGNWRTAHEDIDQLQTAPRLGSFINSTTWIQHGTACTSIMNAGHGGYGIDGFADRAELLLAGIGNGSANAVNLAAGQLDAGDVISSSYGPSVRCGSSSYGTPPEGGAQVDFDAVQNATAKGIIYAFAAGNSNADFDLACWNGIWDLNVRDSGALIIGASRSAMRTRISFSNHGARIDAHAWGENVYSCDYGNLFTGGGDTRQYYSRSFGGTSAASPTVAGVCAVFSSILFEQEGRYPTPLEMRTLLRQHGTPVTDGSLIGRLPDLDKLLAAVGLPDGLQLAQDATVGGMLDLRIAGEANAAYALLVAADRGRTDLGYNRPLLLAPATLQFLAGGTFDGSGNAVKSYAIPNDPVLKDQTAHLQSVDIAGGTLHFGNSVQAHLAD